MKLRIIAISIAVIFLFSIFASAGAHAETNEEKYYDFFSLFFPGSQKYAISISYSPGGVIHIEPYKLSSLKVYIDKINASVNPDFYLKFIVTKGFWVPYYTPSAFNPMAYYEKVKRFNEWLNATGSLTGNVAYVEPKMVHFKKGMDNLTVNLKVKIYGWGNDWGITILAREHNASMWIPVSGVPLSVHKGSDLWSILPYLYSSAIIGTLIFIIFKVRYLDRKKREK